LIYAFSTTWNASSKESQEVAVSLAVYAAELSGAFGWENIDGTSGTWTTTSEDTVDMPVNQCIRAVGELHQKTGFAFVTRYRSEELRVYRNPDGVRVETWCGGDVIGTGSAGGVKAYTGLDLQYFPCCVDLPVDPPDEKNPCCGREMPQ
jgi:hypothetical protein